MNPYLVGGATAFTSIYDTSTDPTELKPGTRGQTPDGRVFYWARNNTGGAYTAGNLLVRPEQVANHVDVTAAAAAAGEKSITVTLGATAATADQYAEGFIHVIDGPGEGQTFKIRTHPAADSAATLTVQLFDPVKVALTASSQCSLHANPYVGAQQGNTDQLDIPVGVAHTAIADGDYGWVQTWGEACVLADETVSAIAQAMTIGSSVAGSVEEDDTATTVSQEFIVGWNLESIADTEHAVVYLTIRP